MKRWQAWITLLLLAVLVFVVPLCVHILKMDKKCTHGRESKGRHRRGTISHRIRKTGRSDWPVFDFLNR